ncbi:MAG: M20/M25/M40 family metallo-hydrolase, partial [Oscillospiraceae bacterium]|nr:M20/M25/M40 family metallo-hydrolase [Oscillospiraceae bacterium]
KENEAELGRGRVILFFERGEEGMGNIRYLLDHMLAQDTKVAAAHGIHVRPDLPTGVIFSPSGPIMAGATGFTVKIRGRGGHGSRPDLSNNPVDCFVAVYSALMALRVRYVSPFEQLTFSVCTLKGSERGNVIPGEVSFGGTARYYNKAVGQTFIDEFTSILDNVTAAYHCTYETNGMRAGDPTLNNADAGAFARGVIRKYLGEDAVAETTPLMGSESFSLLTQLYPGVMVHLGIGNEGIGSGADLHSEYFDVDEAALALGVAETVGFAVDFIQGDEVFAHTPVRDLDAINSWQNRKA